LDGRDATSKVATQFPTKASDMGKIWAPAPSFGIQRKAKLGRYNLWLLKLPVDEDIQKAQ
jgi:hypothetical protein